MQLRIQEGKLHLQFDTNKCKQFSLRHMGIVPYNGKEKDYRPAVQIGTNPGYGHWTKHINTDIFNLKYVEHDDMQLRDGRLVEIILADKTFEVTLHYRFYNGISAVRCWTTVTNLTEEEQILYHVSSFHYNGIPHDACTQIMKCHSGWSQEYIPETGSPMDFGLLTDAKNNYTTKKIAVSNTGTWSSKDESFSTGRCSGT